MHSTEAKLKARDFRRSKKESQSQSKRSFVELQLPPPPVHRKYPIGDLAPSQPLKGPLLGRGKVQRKKTKYCSYHDYFHSIRQCKDRVGINLNTSNIPKTVLTNPEKVASHSHVSCFASITALRPAKSRVTSPSWRHPSGGTAFRPPFSRVIFCGQVNVLYERL